MSEREQADRWWNGWYAKWATFHAQAADDERWASPYPSAWWRSLPDSRAVTIYKQESGR